LIKFVTIEPRKIPQLPHRSSKNTWLSVTNQIALNNNLKSIHALAIPLSQKKTKLATIDQKSHS